jgi:hypothetical protein
MTKLRAATIGLVGLVSLSGSAFASCECACVNGKVEPICTSSIEVKPYCAPTICPAPPPAQAPATLPAIPPPGTSSCKLDQYWNPVSNQYEWRRVCR